MLTPDDIKTGVDALKVLIDVAKFLKGLLPKAEARDRRLQEHIASAIRALYFTPTGILSLLQQVVDGEKLTDTRIRQALGDFNDREWRIADALRLISRAQLHRELGVSLETVRALEALGSGKAGLRRAVQDEVNLYGQKDVKPDKAAAIIPYAVVETRARFIAHTNSHKFILHEDVWKAEGVEDVTERLQAVQL